MSCRSGFVPNVVIRSKVAAGQRRVLLVRRPRRGSRKRVEGYRTESGDIIFTMVVDLVAIPVTSRQ